MKSVVVIPAWCRPEMLAITLKHLRKAQGYIDFPYIIQLDEGFDPDNVSIVATNRGLLSYRIGLPKTKKGTGNSFNVFTALERGLILAEQVQADFVHLIEEDIWVHQNYFSFSEKVHQQFNPWAVSACRNQHLRIQPPQNPTTVYTSRDYQSLAVSFPLSSVREILVHNCDEYFQDMTGYLSAMFPASRFGKMYEEQDGLIARIIEKNNYSVLYPNVPRAFHAGYYSYHREGVRPVGSLSEKILQLESMSEEEMNSRSVYKDIRFMDNTHYEVDKFSIDTEQGLI